MRLWRTTKHENSQTGRKPFIFNTHSSYFHSSAAMKIGFSGRRWLGIMQLSAQV
jgi:hypothetical protein